MFNLLFRIKKRAYLYVFLMLCGIFMATFSLLSSVQLKLVDSHQNEIYCTYSFQIPSQKNPILEPESRYLIKNIKIQSVLETEVISISQNAATTARDILAPTNSILSPLQLTETNGEIVKSSLAVQMIVVLLLSAIGLSFYIIIDKNILFRKIHLYAERPFIAPPSGSSIKNDSSKYNCLLVFYFFIIGKLIYISIYYLLYNRGIITGKVLDNLAHWDSGYYRSIIYHGYDLVRHSDDGQANWAFFPVFPLIGKFLVLLFQSEYSIIIFNQLLMFLSLLMLYNYTVKHYNQRTAMLAILFMAIGSENIYLASIYTESLFIFLSLTTLILIDRRYFYFAAIICGVLSGVRTQGILILPLVLLNYFKYIKWQVSIKSVSNAILLGSLSCLGLLAFMAYLKFHINDPLAFYHIQSSFGRLNKSWLHPIDSFNSLLDGGNQLDKLLSIISVFIVIHFYRIRKYNELLFFSLCFIIEFASKSLQSYSRFFFANYAVYIFLGIYCKDRLRLIFILISICLLTISFMYLWLISSTYVW